MQNAIGKSWPAGGVIAASTMYRVAEGHAIRAAAGRQTLSKARGNRAHISASLLAKVPQGNNY